MKIIGSFVSPYVRKVLVCMELKGLDYEVDPITPFFGNDEFRRLSPLCRIPVLIDDGLVLTDSTVIAEYLDEQFPEPPLMPREPKERARARWLEEFADTRLGDVFIWGLFYPRWSIPVSGASPAIRQRIEQVVDHRHPDRAGLSGRASCPTAAIYSVHRPGRHRDRQLLPQRRLRRVHARRLALASAPPASSSKCLRHPAFEKLHQLEMIQLSASIQGRRQALLDAGAKLTAETYGQREPRKGVMRL